MCRTHGETHRHTHVCKHTQTQMCTLNLHLFWVIGWPGQKILGGAWILKHPISQLSRCGKKNNTADSDLCPFIALGLLGQVAAGYFWGVRQSSPQSSCSCWPHWPNLAELSWVGGCVFPHWYIQTCLLLLLAVSNLTLTGSQGKAMKIPTAKTVYIQGMVFWCCWYQRLILPGHCQILCLSRE